MDSWMRLERALDDPPREALASPEGVRLGAVLVLLADLAGGDLAGGDLEVGDLEVVLTRRRDDLATHAGQISFPGGRVDPGETVEDAAVREAGEEVALDPATMQVLGRLPAFYVAPSRFWLQPVVARWHTPHGLVAAEAEVAEVLRVRLSSLRDPLGWRRVALPPVGATWAWQLDARHLLWGATARVMAAVLEMLDPAWRGGTEPGGLPADRELRPWAVPPGAPGPPRLLGLRERPAATLPFRTAVAEPPAAGAIRAAGQAVADAVVRMAGGEGSSSVLVLAGGGGTGAVGLVAARVLHAAGHDVSVVLDRSPDALGPLAAEAAGPIAGVVRMYGGSLPRAGIVVDALVGAGLRGPLTGPAREIVQSLRHLVAPVLAVDVPSGLHPDDGLVGDCVPADVTMALRVLRPGLLLPGLGPFVGDLYLAGSHDDPVVRVMPGSPGVRWPA